MAVGAVVGRCILMIKILTGLLPSSPFGLNGQSIGRLKVRHRDLKWSFLSARTYFGGREKERERNGRCGPVLLTLLYVML